MLELGQPMHAYERQRLQGAMHVRHAHDGEALTLLDGRSLTLQRDVLVIADEARAIGLAGVMGGEGTAITAEATDILLEVAWFTPDAIAGRARRYGLQTDASQRFERGVDPEAALGALHRATQLLLQICGGAAGPVTEFRAGSPAAERPPVLLRRRQLQRLLGAAFGEDEVVGALSALQMPVEVTADGWRVTPPSWRFDLNLEADVAEEVARLVGFDRIPETPASFPQRFRRRSEALIEERVLLDTLVGRGFQEALNYAFVDPVLQGRLFPDTASVRLANPIASDLAVMRVSLWPGLLKGAMENQRRQHDRVRLFELGSVFLPDGSTAAVREPRRLAGVAIGTRLPEQWGAAAADLDFHDLKGDVQAVLALAGDDGAFEWIAGGPSCLHPGRCASVHRDGKAVGLVGELHPSLVRELDLPAAPLLFELDVEAATSSRLPKGQAISRFPSVRRDISVLLPADTSQADLLKTCREAGGPLLKDLRLFDVYAGKGMEPGRKSVAVGLVFQHNERTLTDDEVEALVAVIMGALGTGLDARLRE
jgi:phenylalanyl-tRNA synthetase beta chain